MPLLTGAAANYASLKYGGPVAEKHGVESILTTPTNLFVNDPDRLGIIVINMSTSLIYAGPDQSLGGANGIYIGANGGSMILQVEPDLILPTIPWWFMAEGVAGNVFWQSVRRFSSSDAVENANGN